MNQNSINLIGVKQSSFGDSQLYRINDIEGLIDTLDRDISEWSDFDTWENIRVQQWVFKRALDIYQGKKIDIKCDCCQYIYLSQSDLERNIYKKCFGIRSAYMIRKVLHEIVLAKARRESDGTYSA